MNLQSQIVVQITLKPCAGKVGVEIDNVHGEGRVARATGILPPIFETELAGTRAKASLNAIDSTMK